MSTVPTMMSLNDIIKYLFGGSFVALLALLVLDPMIVSLGVPLNVSHLPTFLIYTLFITTLAIGSLWVHTREGIALYFGALFIIFFSLLNPEGFRLAFQIIANLILALIVYKAARHYNLRRFSLLTCIFLVVAFATIMFQGEYAGGRLVAAYDANPSHLAALAAGSFLFGSAALTMKGRSLIELIAALSLISIALAALFLTQGRNSILSLFLAFGCTAFVYVIYFKQYKWLLWLIFLFPLSLVIAMNFSDILMFIDRIVVQLGIEGARTHRLALLVDTSAGDVTAGRLNIWKGVLTQFEGVGLYGLGGSEVIVGTPPHNIYISILVEMTLLGLLVYVGLLAYLFISVLRRRQYILSTMVMFLILLGLGNDVLYYKYWWYTVFVLCFWLGYQDLISVRERQQNLVSEPTLEPAR